MLDMKYETDYMNEMMNRNYDVDIDEDDLVSLTIIKNYYYHKNNYILMFNIFIKDE